MAGLYLLADLTVGCLTLYLLKRFLSSRSSPRSLPLPPGPKGLPLLGNVSDLPPPGEQEWLHWRKHKDLYGPVSSITVLGQTIVILNDYATAVELFENRSSNYSDRPSMLFCCEMYVRLRFSTYLSYTFLRVLFGCTRAWRRVHICASRTSLHSYLSPHILPFTHSC